MAPRRFGLRAHLVLLVLAALLPALAFGAAASREALRQMDAMAEARLLETAQALAAALDAQIGAKIAALQALGAAAHLGQGTVEPLPAAFIDHARATAAIFGGWVNLYRRDASLAFSTRLPAGAALPGPGGGLGPGSGGRSIAQTFVTGRPVVSDVALGRLSGQVHAFVFVPFLQRGEVRGVLGAPLLPEQLAAILSGQPMPGGGAIAVTDGRGSFAARSRDLEQVLGQPRPARTDGPLGQSGVLRGQQGRDGQPIRSAYHALASAPGWHVWVNEPEAVFAAARRGPLLALAGGGALALAIGIGGAALVSRRLLRPVQALVTHAEAIADGAAVQPPLPAPRAKVAEFERLRRAVAGAETALRRVQRIGRVGGFRIDLATGRNHRSAEYMDLQGRTARPAEERHEDWVGRLHPEDRARAEARFLAAIADGMPETDYEQEYRILTPAGEVRWIYARAEIERDAAGRALRMVGAHVDVTPLKAAEAALRDSEERLRMALEAARLGAWEVDLETDIARRTPRALEIFGFGTEAETALYPSWRDRVHPEERAALEQAVEAVRSGRSTEYRVEYRFLRPDGHWIWVESHGRATGHHPFDGRPTRLIGTSLDITERKAAEQSQAELVHELDHRAKNTLAVVQAALRLTPRGDAAAYAAAVEGRVAALARAHTLLARGRWRGAELRVVAEEALAPFVGAGEAAPRAILSGPAVSLAATAVQAIAMALHELATNAAKHGALSCPGGQVRLGWQLGGGMLHLVWDEQGGPAVAAAPATRGFGSSLLTATITRQLGGEQRVSWRGSGLLWEARLPLDRLAPGSLEDAARQEPASLPAA